MKNYVLFVASTILVFSCKFLEDILPQSPQKSVKNFVQELKDQGYNYALDDKGFPYMKGQYVIKIEEGYRTTSKENEMIYDLTSKIDGLYQQAGKTHGNISFEKCNCNTYMLMKIEGDVLGSPKTDRALAGVKGVEDADPNGIGYSGKMTSSTNIISYSSKNNIWSTRTQAKPNIDDYYPKYRTTNARAKLALIDTGIDYGYVNELQGVLHTIVPDATLCVMDDILGANYSDEKITSNNIIERGDNNVYDKNGHGPHILSNIINLTNPTNKDKPLSRTKDEFSIIPIKSFDENGKGTLFGVVCGMQYAIKRQVKVINASWGFPQIDTDKISILKDVIDLAAQNDILIVTAAGNDGGALGTDTYLYPAMYHYTENPNDNIIVVTSVEDIATGQTLASFANYGSKHIDIGAERTTTNYFLSPTGSQIIYKAQGTSFSTGLVSGSAIYAILFGGANNVSSIKNYIFTNQNMTTNGAASLSSKIQGGKILKFYSN